MTADGPFDVAVVGAGPAGSSTALRLARRGARVALLDARSFPRSKPCGDCLSPGATPLLEDLGVLEDVERTGAGALAGWRIRTPGGRWFGGRFGRSPGGPAPGPRRPGSADRAPDRDGGGAAPPREGLALPRRDLDAALVRAAVGAGAELRERTRVFGLLRDGGRVRGVEARGGDGDRLALEADVVVGADGLRSTVARRLAGVRRGPHPRLALVARAAGVEPPDAPAEAPGASGPFGEMRLGRGGCLGLAPVGGGRWNATLVVPKRRAPEISADRRGFFRRGLSAYGVRHRFRDAALLAPLEITGPFRVTPRRRAAPGALLAGDAAGYVDPLTGQGVHRALVTGRAAASAAAALAGARRRARREAVRRRYRLELRRLLGPGRTLQKIVDAVCRRPRLVEVVGRLLAARPGLARIFVDVTGDRLTPPALVDPRRLAPALADGRQRAADGPVRPASRHPHDPAT